MIKQDSNVDVLLYLLRSLQDKAQVMTYKMPVSGVVFRNQDFSKVTEITTNDYQHKVGEFLLFVEDPADDRRRIKAGFLAGTSGCYALFEILAVAREPNNDLIALTLKYIGTNK